MSKASLPQGPDMWYLTFYEKKYPYTKPQSPTPFVSKSHPSHFCTKLVSKTKNLVWNQYTLFDSSRFIYSDCESSPVKMAMPTGEHCWKKNSGAPWARTSNLRSFWIDSKSNALSTALSRKICELGFKHCTVHRYSTCIALVKLGIQRTLGCWFEPMVHHYFSSSNVCLLTIRMNEAWRIK